MWWLLTVASLAPRARRIVLIPALLGFAVLSGGSAPVLRATAATVAYLLTRLAGRPVLPLPAMWGVVAGLVVLEPAALLQPGFQLSAGVSLALIRWVGPLAEAAEVLPRWLGSALAVTCVGQLASWPLVGVAFAGVPPLGGAGQPPGCAAGVAAGGIERRRGLRGGRLGPRREPPGLGRGDRQRCPGPHLGLGLGLHLAVWAPRLLPSWPLAPSCSWPA
ncbi:MAG: ComEC/Rec2 family competence protein [Thermoanaerobaculaceae bacterium]